MTSLEVGLESISCLGSHPPRVGKIIQWTGVTALMTFRSILSSIFQIMMRFTPQSRSLSLKPTCRLSDHHAVRLVCQFLSFAAGSKLGETVNLKVNSHDK